MRGAILVALAACGTPTVSPALIDAREPDAPAPTLHITASVDSTRFITREHMLASGEMQISGEPFAEAMGRDLGGYSRDALPTDLYNDPVLGVTWTDPAGFSSGVESYEYSKQPMNFLAFESGGGTALYHAARMPDLASAIQHYAAGSHALGRFVFASQPFGWPGIWPTAHVFAELDPAIDPTSGFGTCTISSDDTPQNAGTPELCGDYECDATTLHLRDRSAQIDPTITPGADGFSAWKYGLWTINYLQIMHDDLEAAVDAVPEPDLGLVGTAGYPVHLGSSDIEGFQAQMFVAMLDARADDWLLRLATTDGATLSGFATIAAAKAYDYATPLRWFPGKIAVTETADASGFPRPAYAIAGATPDVLDLAGLALGYAELYALTDPGNPDIGGSQPVRAMFDGDPFDGAAIRDRALAMMRVAVIDLDRMHGADELTPVEAAYTILGLRTVLRTLGSQLELYSNNTPDAPIAGALDALPIHYPGDATLTFGARVRQIIHARADALAAHTVTDSLDDHTATIRGLFAAYLATGDVRYRTRALAVYADLEATLYDPQARIYTTSHTAETVASFDVTYTPLRFGLLQSTLRDVYELVATRPGGEALVIPLEQRVARLNKLVLDGWDDANRDQHVYSPECVQGYNGSVPRGGLQMAERALTGEIGRATDEAGGGPPSSDRNYNCVPEIDDAHLPAGLAASITFHIARPSDAP